MSLINKAIGNNIFSKTLDRLFSSGLSKGADPSDRLRASAKWSVRNEASDFRVKVTLPPSSSVWPIFLVQTKETLKQSMTTMDQYQQRLRQILCCFL